MTDYSKGEVTLCLKILPSISILAPSCHSLTSGEHPRTPCASPAGHWDSPAALSSESLQRTACCRLPSFL